MMKSFAAAAALAALSRPALAQGATCIAQEDMTAATIYAMPIMVDSVQRKCSAQLSSTGFLARNGAAFAKPYRAQQSRHWAATARVLTAFTSSPQAKSMGSGEQLSAFSSLFKDQPEVMRPFVDASISSMVASKIKVQDCAKIERGMELIAPLPPENAGGIVALILDSADGNLPKMCPLKRK